MPTIKSISFLGQRKFHAFLLMLLFLVACSSTNTPPPTPTPAPITFSPVDLGIPADALNSPIVGNLDPTTPMKVNVLFKLNPSQQKQFQKVANNQQDLQKEANKIGITDAQYQKIQNFLDTQKITFHLSKLHTSVEADGTADAMSHLFQTTFVNHDYQGRTFYAPKTPPLIPTQVAQLVVSITGLDNYGPRSKTGLSMHARDTKSVAKAQMDCQGLSDPQMVSNRDIAHAYGYDQFLNNGYTGKGLTVNLVEIDGFSQADVDNYGACVGYKGTITVKTIGPTPSPGGESTLDINMIQGLAPEVNIVDYQTSDNSAQSLINVLQQLVDDNTNNAGTGNVVSMSIGFVENQMTSNDLNAMDQQLSVLTQTEHMTMFVSSGDCGAFASEVFGQPSVNFPASSPNAVAVGGSILQTDGNGNRAHEVVWADANPDQTKCANTWGSGGGNSVAFARPTWQTGSGTQNTQSTGERQVPDIAGAAFNLAVYFNGQWEAALGTSAATPIWAAGMVLVNEKIIQNAGAFAAGPALFYNVANNPGQFSPYFDVTEGGAGSTATFSAAPGWDFATGWGTPNLPGFYQALAALVNAA